MQQALQKVDVPPTPAASVPRFVYPKLTTAPAETGSQYERNGASGAHLGQTSPMPLSPMLSIVPCRCRGSQLANDNSFGLFRWTSWLQTRSLPFNGLGRVFPAV